MRVLLLTIGHFVNINKSGIYTDLLRYFRRQGHEVYIVSQLERRLRQDTYCEESEGTKLLRVKTGNITKSHWIEKGLSSLMISTQYWTAINQFWSDESFDLILYSTPPITLEKVVRKLKKRHGAYTYLILKDIFPQNAVDLGILKLKGIKGIIYTYFRNKEKTIYEISDKIGCMSQANIDYIQKNNRGLDAGKLDLCPNTIDNQLIEDIDKLALKKKYQLPPDKIICLYGGNFGKPQNVDFIIDVLLHARQLDALHFVMCGSGTDFYKIKHFKDENSSANLSVFGNLPFGEYSQLLMVADIGMIFLDYRFTIPNFPSRILDYMNFALPLLAATDEVTDVREMIQVNKLGWWCKSDNQEEFIQILKDIMSRKEDLENIGRRSKEYMIKNFTTEHAYNAIMSAYSKERNKTYV